MSKAGKRLIAAAKEARYIARDPMSYMDKKGRRYRAIWQISKAPSLLSQLIEAQDRFESEIACIYGNENCPICKK
jgi:hypothetical protein